MTASVLQESPAVYVSTIPLDQQRVGAAAAYCSDGRFGEQMDEFLHKCLGLPRYDRVAMPGGAACLGGHGTTLCEQIALERQLEFLVKEHGLRRVVLIAHEGCAFYKNLWTGQSTEQQQAADLRKAADRIRQWNSSLQVEAYFARKRDGRVTFESWGKWPEISSPVLAAKPASVPKASPAPTPTAPPPLITPRKRPVMTR